MALIPADIGLRLRLDNELLPQQVAPVQEIAADLPRLQAGQIFTAQIRDVLPQNTYLALVAGKTVTLSLPESVKSGDILELVVVDQTPKTIIARLASQPGGATVDTTPYQHTTLSLTAQMLGTLLTAEGETPTAAPLNRGQPLLAQPPQSGADLVPVLSKAVTQSGLFYEAHQAQWVAGKLPLRNLLQEPQGAHPASVRAAALPPALTNSPAMALVQSLNQSSTLTQPVVPDSAVPTLPVVNINIDAESMAVVPPKDGSQPGKPAQALSNSPEPLTTPTLSPQLSKAVAESLLLYLANQSQEAELQGRLTAQTSNSVQSEIEPPAAHAKNLSQPAMSSSMPATPSATMSPVTGHADAVEVMRLQANPQAGGPAQALSMPDDLRALVQQQLDAAGTQRLLWHGEVWPGQTMQWQLEWQDQGSRNSGGGAAEPWSTTLRLSTPRLGTLEASLQLGAAGVRIALSTANGDSAADMRAGAADLGKALETAGVPLLGFSVKLDQENQT